MNANSKNARKRPGAIVWHNDELKIISSQNVGEKHVVVNNVDKVVKSKIRLAKVGDKVEYKDLTDLPERCKDHSNMHITYIRKNGSIGTDCDLYPATDSTHYSHFRKPTTTA